jgi:hypothetical protein
MSVGLTDEQQEALVGLVRSSLTNAHACLDYFRRHDEGGTDDAMLIDQLEMWAENCSIVLQHVEA